MARPKAALEFIQHDVGMYNSPDMVRFTRSLDVGKVQAMGHVSILMQWIGCYSPFGDLTKFDDDTISDAAMWEGDPKVFIEGLRYSGFLEEDDDGRRFHNWDERYSPILEKRESDAKRQRIKRERDKSQASHTDVTVTSRDGPELSEVKEVSKESNLTKDTDDPDV